MWWHEHKSTLQLHFADLPHYPPAMQLRLLLSLLPSNKLNLKLRTQLEAILQENPHLTPRAKALLRKLRPTARELLLDHSYRCECFSLNKDLESLFQKSLRQSTSQAASERKAQRERKALREAELQYLESLAMASPRELPTAMNDPLNFLGVE